MRPFRVAILAALALHAGVLIVGRTMRLPPLATSDDLTPLRVVDIVMEPVPLPRSEPLPEEPLAKSLPGIALPSPERPRSALSHDPLPRTPPGAENPPPAPGVLPQPPATRFDELPPDQPGTLLTVPGVPGLNGAGVWSIPGVVPSPGAPAPAPTEAPKPREVDKDIAGQVIREAMGTRDKTLGLELPAAGTVASVVGEVVRASDVPDVARSSIEFRVSASGQVLGYRVVGMHGGTSETWDKVARAAAARLAGRGLTMAAAYSHGATITIDVISNVQVPAGSAGGLAGAGLAFDVANVGAHATRVVRTSFRVAAAR